VNYIQQDDGDVSDAVIELDDDDDDDDDDDEIRVVDQPKKEGVFQYSQEGYAPDCSNDA
jgi:hypothetical protein